MVSDLFFVPLIAHALQQPDPRAAVVQAFEQIRTAGESPHYYLGYQQYLYFMHAAGEAQTLTRPLTTDVSVERDGVVLATCSFAPGDAPQTVQGMLPGHYRICAETGLLLWQGFVAEQDVLWPRAFPGQPIHLAADTGHLDLKPTRTVDLPDVGLVLNWYAEVESGSLEIEITAAELED